MRKAARRNRIRINGVLYEAVKNEDPDRVFLVGHEYVCLDDDYDEGFTVVKKRGNKLTISPKDSFGTYKYIDLKLHKNHGSEELLYFTNDEVDNDEVDDRGNPLKWYDRDDFADLEDF